MQKALENALRRADGHPVSEAESQITLRVVDFQKRRDIYTITRAAAINEYLLAMTVKAQAFRNGEPVGEPMEVKVHRTMDYADSEVLGKQEEEETIWSEMRIDAADQIVRRLTFLKAAAPIESLRPDTPLKPLYIIHGEEDLLRIEALDTLRAAAKKQGYLNREVYTAENNFDWNELLHSAGSAGLFADLKLLEIHIPNGKPGKNGGDALQAFAERLPEDTVTLILLPKLEKTQIQSKWFSALAGKGIVLEAKAVAPHALPQWIQGRLKQQGLDIEPEALALFAERVEGNLLAARQEIEKLALLHPQGHLINITDAEAAVATVARFDVFQLAGAWMKGDALRVSRLLDGLEEEGEEPVLLLWAVAEDIRTLIHLTAALKQGQNIQSLRNSLRLWGDKQTLAPMAAKRISINRLLDALKTCAKIDRIIKGAEEGDAWTEFKQLVTSLAA